MTTPQPHVHADKIIQLAKDSSLNAYWRHPHPTGKWAEWVGDGRFPDFNCMLDWHVGHEPPQEPEVMEFAFKGNAPWRTEPPMGTMYWAADSGGYVYSIAWCQTSLDLRRLENGLCWKTEADALAFRDAYRAAAFGEGKP